MSPEDPIRPATPSGGHPLRVVAGLDNLEIITVLGPSGSGKSLIASSIAELITRAHDGPNVLLIDGDIYSRGLTVRAESVLGRLQCDYLHDSLMGRNENVSALKLTDSLFRRTPSHEANDGAIYFLPSAPPETLNPVGWIWKLSEDELNDRVAKVMAFAAERHSARCVVVDTVNIAEPVAAALAAASNILILVGNGEKGTAESHFKNLSSLWPDGCIIQPITVVNRVNAPGEDSLFADRCHLIPHLRLVSEQENDDPEAESIMDWIDFDRRLIFILSRSLGPKCRGLLPPWYACFPSVWRSLARVVQACQPTVLSLVRNEILTAAAIALPALTCVALASGPPGASQAGNMATERAAVGYLVGLAGMLVSSYYGASLMFQTPLFPAIIRSLKRGDVDWFLDRVRLTRKECDTCSPEKRFRLADKRLRRLCQAMDIVWRSVQKFPGLM